MDDVRELQIERNFSELEKEFDELHDKDYGIK
jgi:hypothetical protein